MSLAIRTEGLSRRFRKRIALEPIDLAVPAGCLFGYLGPNGAGKTTTIRLLLGLARPTSGESRVLELPVPKGLGQLRHRVGSVLENPAFYPRFSARDNLRILARIADDNPAFGRIDDLLTRVGLDDRGGDQVRTFSHGMRQRLAIAAALLHNPELIILDEPATALDPAGMRDVRDLLAMLRKEGKTIFISSHLLSEVEQICDHVAIVSKGKMMYQGTLTGLTAGAIAVRVEIEDLAAAEEALRPTGWTVARRGDDLVVSGASGSEVNKALADRGLHARGISEQGRTLEDVFLTLTEETPNG